MTPSALTKSAVSVFKKKKKLAMYCTSAQVKFSTWLYCYRSGFFLRSLAMFYIALGFFFKA